MSDSLIFLGLMAMLVFIVYLIVAIVSVIRKNGKAKKNFIVTGCLFWGAIILMGIGGAIGAKETEVNQAVVIPSISPTITNQPSPDIKTSAAPATVKPAVTATTSTSSPKPSPVSTPTASPSPTPTMTAKVSIGATSEEIYNSVYYKNCTDAKSQGVYNIKKGDPGYRSALDKDGDGIACEK